MSESEQRFFIIIIIITDETLLQCVINNSIHFFIFKTSFLLPPPKTQCLPTVCQFYIYSVLFLCSVGRDYLMTAKKEKSQARAAFAKRFSGFSRFLRKVFLCNGWPPTCCLVVWLIWIPFIVFNWNELCFFCLINGRAGICLQGAFGKLSILASKWKRKYFSLFQSILARIEQSSSKYFSLFQYVFLFFYQYFILSFNKCVS